ncbi:pectin lyase-like protein [Hymenopellis radicata]|nr:pectin lyase-like protein [Hymenopellis radicata]
MFLRLSAFTILVALVSAVTIDKRAAPIDQLVGFATLKWSTTGGAEELLRRLLVTLSLRFARRDRGDPKIVEINGIITGDGDTIDVGNHTTVVGIGANSGVTGAERTLIFRNLQLSKSPAPTDLIELQTSTNIWVDFTSDLTHDKDFYDGQLDMNHGTDTGDEDSGHLRVTYHHNHFLEINSRTPSLRFGTGHIYSNFFDNVLDSAVDSRDGAQTLIEDNQFTNVVDPIETTLNAGFAVQRSNVFTNTTVGAIDAGTLTSVPYTYTIDAAASVPAIVQASAGAGKVTGL